MKIMTHLFRVRLILAWTMAAFTFTPFALSQQKQQPREQDFPLERVKSVSFQVKTFWANTKRNTGYTLLPEQELMVYALRPGSLRIEASRPKGLKEGEEWIANPFNLLISNGKDQLELARESKLYYHYKAALKLDEVDSRNGLHIKISPDILFTDNPLRDFKFEGEVEKEGKAVVVYTTELPYKNGKVKYVLWLDRKTKLPMRLAIFMPNKSGNVIESERAEFFNWKLNPKLSPSLFDPTPPPNAKPAPPLGVIQKPM